MQYTIEGNILSIMYETTDLTWQKYVFTLDNLDPENEIARWHLSRRRVEKVLDNADKLMIFRGIPEVLPSAGVEPIYPSSFETIIVRYEPDASRKFEGVERIVHNNGRTKEDVQAAFLAGENAIE